MRVCSLANDLILLQTLRPIEVEVLVCGCPEIKLEELRKVCKYDGYSDRDQNVRYTCISKYWIRLQHMWYCKFQKQQRDKTLIYKTFANNFYLVVFPQYCTTMVLE